MRFLALFALLVSCASIQSKAEYPDDWWRVIPQSELKSWEIPPQAADRNKSEVILSKRTELGILSNFALTPFEYRGKKYASLEGFWQMMKFPEGAKDPRFRKDIIWEFTRDQVAAMSAFAAKDAGTKASANMKKLGIEWIAFEGEIIFYKTKAEGIQKHYDLIVEGTREKINQNPEVQRILRATGDLKLLPDHKQDEGATKAYRYFEIYMMLRETASN